MLFYLFLKLFALYACTALVLGFKNVCYKNNYGLTPYFFFLGAFVWVDAFILSFFWLLIIAATCIAADPFLFYSIFALFWVVRSLGEVIYWFLEQYSLKVRNPPATLFLGNYFGDSIHIVYQLFWQCFLVLSLLAAVWSLSNLF